MTDASTTLQQAYLVDLENQEHLLFDFMPEDFSEEKSANWDPTEIIGRSEPIIGYSHSGPRTFSIVLMFFASKFAGEPIQADAYLTNVKKKVDWLRSLAYPDYTGQLVRPPHKVLFAIGTLIQSICVATSVNPTYRGPWSETLLPMIAEVSLSLQEVNPVPFSYNEVREGRDLGSVSQRTAQVPNTRSNVGRGGPSSLQAITGTSVPSIPKPQTMEQYRDRFSKPQNKRVVRSMVFEEE